MTHPQKDLVPPRPILIAHPSWRRVLEEDDLRRREALAAFAKAEDARVQLVHALQFWIAAALIGWAAVVIALWILL